MKLVVFSDSHGRYRKMQSAAALHPDAEAFIFLGDGERDVRIAFEGCRTPVVSVVGNCDGIFSLGEKSPAECVLELGEKRIMCMHGHLHGVKYGLSAAAAYAAKKDIDLLLYGHTHCPLETRENGVILFNPGSIGEGSYGVVHIEGGQILCSHGSVK